MSKCTTWEIIFSKSIWTMQTVQQFIFLELLYHCTMFDEHNGPGRFVAKTISQSQHWLLNFMFTFLIVGNWLSDIISGSIADTCFWLTCDWKINIIQQSLLFLLLFFVLFVVPSRQHNWINKLVHWKGVFKWSRLRWLLAAVPFVEMFSHCAKCQTPAKIFEYVWKWTKGRVRVMLSHI